MSGLYAAEILENLESKLTLYQRTKNHNKIKKKTDEFNDFILNIIIINIIIDIYNYINIIYDIPSL